MWLKNAFSVDRIVQSKLHYAKIFASVKIKNGISLIHRPGNATRGLFFLRKGRQISPFAPLSRNDTQKTLVEMTGRRIDEIH